MIDADSLPACPGCYLFRDKHGRVIYVGKAKNIKNRVKSYMHHTIEDPKTRAMLDHVERVEVIATDSETEALLLENTLIKKHQPKYNIRLKDAKTYAYIRLTDEAFPRLTIARRKTGGGKYFGPFVSAEERDYVLRFLQKTFLLRTCKKMPKKPCLRYHINLCCAPCAGHVSQEEYQKRIARAVTVLSGNVAELLSEMEATMKRLAKENEFERALELRNQIAAVSRLSERQKIQRERTYNEDVLSYRVHDGTVYLMVFNIHRGTLANKNEYVFDHGDAFLEEFLVQYYDEHPVPAELILPVPVEDAVISYLTVKRGKRVRVTVPQRGVKKELLGLARKNIDITFFGNMERVEALKDALRLTVNPAVIECFDISHLSGTSVVGSMVRFTNGIPDKSAYRRFKIKTVEGIDDCAAIAEVVRRRYSRLKREGAALPDLIIIDGGRGQLNAALEELKKLALAIPTISIAKREEELYMPGRTRPLKLPEKHRGLQYVRGIRDEAHRFALAYNRLLRRKEVIP